MRTLTIAYEPPTLADLAVLIQIEDTGRLTELVRKCSPVIQLGDWNEHKNRVMFTNTHFQRRLTTICHGHSDADQTSPSRSQHHGLIALRCFEHVKSMYNSLPAGRATLSVPSQRRHSVITVRTVGHAGAVEVGNDEDDLEGQSNSATQSSPPDCYYSIKHLFRHLSEGFADVAQVLYEDDPGFWGLQSELRDRWLADFHTLTTDLKDLSVAGMSALHVAAGIGAKELVSTLLQKSGPQALAWTTQDGKTAVSI